jgi:hypothetical protein
MNCTIGRDTLSAYWDDELAPRERDAVREHIAACSDCLRELDALKKGTGRLRALRARKAPPAVAEGVRLEINRLRRTWLRAGLAAAMLIGLTAAVIAMSTPRPAPALPPAAVVPVIVVSADDLGSVREEVHELLDAFHAPVVTGAPDLGHDPLLKDTCITTYLTEAERDALERHVDRLAGRAIPAGTWSAQGGARRRVVIRFEEAPLAH